MLISKFNVEAVLLAILVMSAVSCGMLTTAKTDSTGNAVKTSAEAVENPNNDETDEAETFTVTIMPHKIRVRIEEPVMVDLRVMNTSQTTQFIEVMSCSWDEHWQSSNHQVSWRRWACFGNFPETVTLERNAAYEKTMSMHIVTGKPTEQVSFKMGFTPNNSKRTFWSNETTFTVEPTAEANE